MQDETGRPAYASVADLRGFIVAESPPGRFRVALDMCVVAVQPRRQYLKLELVARCLESRAAEVIPILDYLDPPRRGTFVCRLLLWFPPGVHVAEHGYQVGFSYHFKDVFGLDIFNTQVSGIARYEQQLITLPLPPRDESGGGPQDEGHNMKNALHRHVSVASRSSGAHWRVVARNLQPNLREEEMMARSIPH